VPRHAKTAMVPPPESLSQEEINAEQDKMHSALAKAREGDVTELNRLYDNIPSLAQIIGKKLLQAEGEIIKWFGELGEGPLLYLDSMRDELGYATASGLERLLMDRVVVCWLRVQQAEHIKVDKDKDGITLQWATVWERRLAIAHRNFLSACKTLAQVRKLLKPRVTQVNIGGQQVNVANIDGASAEDELGRQRRYREEDLDALLEPGPDPGA